MELVFIAIPIYKQAPAASEMRSLDQCIKILHAYPVIFIAPQSLDTQAYEERCRDRVDFKIIRFADQYFENIAGYNRLMLSPSFYKKFLNYKFMLVYQLDAWVFKDELRYWCIQGYDFIGAPHLPAENAEGEMQFLKNYAKFLEVISGIFKITRKVKNVGNGGFSLRKVKTCYWMLRLLKSKVLRWGQNNEDVFFKYWGNLLYPLFKMPGDQTALLFSIEVLPEVSLKQISPAIPFGCHAFEKYDKRNWQRVMEQH
ncbi:DUF5672 family protein [Mucilaginibacter sabulilitoris]|uniref:DUF5672 family protein n=1 Tax=Mucilaginibacter sabulilitoris TaxID=1173583 RepID=A0ABZ0THH1_9SPHI|nr:DUF5672 family protein [Mucilaginibacter sabulilitoris]WPU91643.1 DUF5672 family protein [Mucilaginibacter sabulilitoris]